MKKEDYLDAIYAECDKVTSNDKKQLRKYSQNVEKIRKKALKDKDISKEEYGNIIMMMNASLSIRLYGIELEDS